MVEKKQEIHDKIEKLEEKIEERDREERKYNTVIKNVKFNDGRMTSKGIYKAKA